MSIVEKAAAQLKSRESGQRVTMLGGSRMAEQSPDESMGRTDRPPLHLDEKNLRKQGLMPPESASQWISRELQRIKQPILKVMARETGMDALPPNRLMITSPNPGDGKSFTAFNLAMSLADEMDYSVLLVDGDVAKASVTQYLGLKEEPGLMHLLSHPQADAGDCVIETDVPRLSILPAGQHSRRTAESLSSRRMKIVLEELSTDPSRIILFDSPPLLATAEAQTLSGNVGQILLVVRAGHTEKRAVESALSLIEPSNAEISLILSQGRPGFEDRYAGYYGMYPADRGFHGAAS